MKFSTSSGIYGLLRIAMLLLGSAFFGPIGIIVAIGIVIFAITNESDSSKKR